MGHGDGGGEGLGGGRGSDTSGVLAGSLVACCFIIFLWIIGIPLFIGGVVMVQSDEGTYYGGIVCIILSIFFVIGGIVLIVRTCSSGSGRRGQVIQTGAGPTVVTTHTTVIQTGYPAQQPQPYAGQQPPPHPYAGQPQPYAGQPQPYAGQPQPYAGQPQPYAGQAPPVAGQAPPYTEQPPPYSSQQQPAYNPDYKPHEVSQPQASALPAKN